MEFFLLSLQFYRQTLPDMVWLSAAHRHFAKSRGERKGLTVRVARPKTLLSMGESGAKDEKQMKEKDLWCFLHACTECDSYLLPACVQTLHFRVAVCPVEVGGCGSFDETQQGRQCLFNASRPFYCPGQVRDIYFPLIMKACASCCNKRRELFPILA